MSNKIPHRFNDHGEEVVYSTDPDFYEKLSAIIEIFREHDIKDQKRISKKMEEWYNNSANKRLKETNAKKTND